jgi:hypothetical protein
MMKMLFDWWHGSKEPSLLDRKDIPTRVLVCGGRDYSNSDAVWRALDRLVVDGRKITVIEGGAEGADLWARTWCHKHGVPIITVCAEWEKYGHAAGPIRNQRMLDEWDPDIVLQFPGGTGTADMVESGSGWKAGAESR